MAISRTKSEIVIVGRDKATPAVQKVSTGFEGLRNIIAGIGIERMLQGAIQAVQGFASDSVDAFIQYENSQKGIESVARAFGQNVGATKTAILDYIKDGLIPLTDATFAFKNLMSSGFGLEDTIRLMNIMKDTAAFNRQGMFTMGQAVERASQGIKNQNSILTDSTGIQKNLSVILAEMGFTMQDLTDKTKGAAARQALLIGFMKEGAFAAGDAITVADTLAGKMSALSVATFDLQVAIGMKLEPAMKKIVAVTGEVVVWLRDNLTVVIEKATIAVAAFTAVIIVLVGPSVLAALPAVATAAGSAVLWFAGAMTGATGATVAFGVAINALTLGGFTVLMGIIAAVTFAIWKLSEIVIVIYKWFWSWRDAVRAVNAELELTRTSTDLLGALNFKMGTSFTDLATAINVHRQWMVDLQEANAKVSASQVSLSTSTQNMVKKITGAFSEKNIQFRVEQLFAAYEKLQKEGFTAAQAMLHLDGMSKKLAGDIRLQTGALDDQIESWLRFTRTVKAAISEEAAFARRLESLAPEALAIQMKSVTDQVGVLQKKFGDTEGLALGADAVLKVYKNLIRTGADIPKPFELLAIQAENAKNVMNEMAVGPMEQILKLSNQVGAAGKEAMDLAETLGIDPETMNEFIKLRRLMIDQMLLEVRLKRDLVAINELSRESLISLSDNGLLPNVLAMRSMIDAELVLAEAKAKNIDLTKEQTQAILQQAAITEAFAHVQGDSSRWMQMINEKMGQFVEKGEEVPLSIRLMASAFNSAQMASQNFGNSLADAILQGGLSFKNATKFIKQALGDALAAEGRSVMLQGFAKIATNLFPPVPPGIAAGAKMVAAGGAMLAFARTLGGGASGASTGGASAGEAAAGAGAPIVERPAPFTQEVNLIFNGPIMSSPEEFARDVADKLREVAQDNKVIFDQVN